MTARVSIPTVARSRLACCLLLLTSFQAPAIIPPAGVVINEWMTENVSTISTSAGDFVPWFELFNPNTHPVDLAGAFLTDDPNNPTKYMIQPDFAIPAGGYLVVWADGGDTEAGGEIHVNFTLNPGGGFIGIGSPFGGIAESITYSRQTPDIGAGSFPNGQNSVFPMNIPTPGAANTLGPLIVAQPQDQSVLPGETATFHVEAIGLEPLSYEWLAFGTSIHGANGPTLTLNRVTTADEGDYLVRISNANGTVQSSRAASLFVLEPPVITRQPEDVLLSPAAGSAQFCVTVRGNSLSYQWYKNGFELTGKTSRCLRLTDITTEDGGLYSVSVVNAVGTDVSESARLVFDLPGSLPAADAFADRSFLSSNGWLTGDNRSASRESGEPFHANRLGSNSVWYGWQAPETGIATFESVGSTFDTVLAVYTGTSVSNLTLIAADDDGEQFGASRVQFNTVRHTTYQIAIDGFENTSGTFLLKWSHARTTNLLPRFVQQPENQAVPRGGTAVFTATSATPGDTFQWYFNDLPIKGATSATLTMESVQSSQVGKYSVALTSAAGLAVLSKVGKLGIGNCPTTVMEDKLLSFIIPCFQSFSLASLPPSDTNAFTQGAFLGINLGEQGDSEDSNYGNDSAPVTCSQQTHLAKKRLWAYYEAEANGVLEFDSLGSSVPVDLVAHSYTANPVFSVLGCDFTNAPIRPSRVRIANATQGARYVILTSSQSGAAGQVRLNHRLGSAPPISQPLATHQVLEGDTLQLQISAPGWVPPPQYQWRRDGMMLPGATASTLLLSPLQCADAGLYSVSVSNWVRSVIHPVAVVSLDAPIALSGSIVLIGTAAHFKINAIGGSPFVLESATGIPSVWIPVKTNPLPCIPFELFVPITPQPPIRLYRAVEVP